jgi:tetratricopeptide (TPR) repeat protein
MNGAMTLATGARTAWQSASGAGEARIFGGICVLLGMVLLIALLLWMWRDNRRRKGQLAASVAAGDLPAGDLPAGDGDEDRGWGGVRPRLWRAVGALIADGTAGAATRVRSAAAITADRLAPLVGGVKAACIVWAGRVASRVPRLTPRAAKQDESPGGSVENAVASDPVDPTPEPAESAYDLLQRGSELLKGHHNAQAAVVLERAARLEPRKGSILEALGRAYFNSGQHARAAETFEALLDVDPSADYGHFALGLCFGRLGRPNEALTHLRLAVAMDPGSRTYTRALEKAETAGAQPQDRRASSDN